LAAVGAILRYATNIHVEGVSIDTVGLILMIAGAVIFVIALFQEILWRDRRRGEPPAVEERREVREPPRY
jgi:TRAP-type C4-dicarboxylate transport system permease small subunit